MPRQAETMNVFLTAPIQVRTHTRLKSINLSKAISRTYYIPEFFITFPLKEKTFFIQPAYKSQFLCKFAHGDT
ncbi:MAG: hypothetical protein ACFNLC_07480, partial [Prevotella denticola]